MQVISQLASSLNRRDEAPNQQLAKEIAQKKDTTAVRELISLLSYKDKNIQSDAIKVLYEIGVVQPLLIAPFDTVFIELLGSKNNRLVWGSMSALVPIASFKPKSIYTHLPKILDAAEKGTVITKDNAISILVKLAAHKAYTSQALSLLMDQLKTAATNQLPMYAENILPVITPSFKQEFITILHTRLKETDKESQKKRIEKVIRKMKAY